MNTAALLALLGDLYAQVTQLAQEAAHLRAQLAEQQPPADP